MLNHQQAAFLKAVQRRMNHSAESAWAVYQVFVCEGMGVEAGILCGLSSCIHDPNFPMGDMHFYFVLCQRQGSLLAGARD